jgi:hypothetical protein
MKHPIDDAKRFPIAVSLQIDKITNTRNLPIVGLDVGGDAFRTYAVQKLKLGNHDKSLSLKFEPNNRTFTSLAMARTPACSVANRTENERNESEQKEPDTASLSF